MNRVSTLRTRLIISAVKSLPGSFVKDIVAYVRPQLLHTERYEHGRCGVRLDLDKLVNAGAVRVDMNGRVFPVEQV
jgi:hypothetical protein